MRYLAGSHTPRTLCVANLRLAQLALRELGAV